jgi:hypothetical protein
MKWFTAFAISALVVPAGLALVGACSSDATSAPEADAATDAKSSSSSSSSSSGGGDASPDAGQSITARGGALATSLGCHGCHDSSAGVMAGNNDGIQRPVASGNTTIYPANITPDKDTGIADWTDADIARAIRTGVDDQCMTLCSVMPHFSSISDDDMAALIAYLRALPPINNDVTNQGCPDVDAGQGQKVDAGCN